VLVVTVIYNLFAWPFTSMIPVIGRDRLHLGPEGVGLLATMDGIGAFAGAMLLALSATPRWYGRAYLGGVICYLITAVVFALVQSPAQAAAALLLTGLGGAGFGTMQATLVYLAAPPERPQTSLRGSIANCAAARSRRMPMAPIRITAGIAYDPAGFANTDLGRAGSVVATLFFMSPPGSES
jgi:MFS family permease